MRTVSIAFCFTLLIVLFQCTNDAERKEVGKNIEGDQSQDLSQTDGESLAKIYCASCHLYPSPDLLDKYTWSNFVLIRMGALLGIYQQGNGYASKVPDEWMEPGIGGQRIKAANIYPEEALISVEQWQKIINFYLENAPEQLATSNNPTINVGIPFFDTKPFTQNDDLTPLVQSMAVDEDNKHIYAAEYKGGIYQYNYQGKKLGKYGTNSHIVEMKADKDGFMTLDMATRYASDNPKGLLKSASSFYQYKFQKYEFVMPNLMRPVDFTTGDLNNNGREDILVAEYGNMLGALSWFDQIEEDKYIKQVLFPDDGAIKSEIRDVNNDGQSDIIALMGNSDEGIDWYINKGNGKFQRERKLRFPPTNGSTHFQLLDFNGDGVEDILYSNGDNGDYKPLMKPYHGIHLYLNNNGDYEESFFIPLNGVYQAEAIDFDLDGDLDIAAVSFHPDFDNNQKEGFVIFENNGRNNFSRYTIDQFADSRWMRFITTDIEADGDVDILLSAMNIKTPEVPEKVVEGWKKGNLPILLLENKTK